MICKDMKYTALYRALGFLETSLDVYLKEYEDGGITVFADRQEVDFGSIPCRYDRLLRHKDFVVLECVDRLLTKGYRAGDIRLFPGDCDVSVRLPNGGSMGIICEQWGDDYAAAEEGGFPVGYDYNVLYTSRLVSGLIEYKNLIKTDDVYSHGIFDSVRKSDFHLSKKLIPSIEHSDDAGDFEIFEDELVFYRGVKNTVTVPEGISSIAACAFWNNAHVERVILPRSLKTIGGDCFYCCKNLKHLTIPANVKVMGNNPFSGCPKLKLKNESREFILEDGVLYNGDRTSVIYFEISNPHSRFSIPDTVKRIGKHCFFGCAGLTEIIVPESVISMENNPFSGCGKLSVENRSPYYVFEDGIIYDRYRSLIAGCLSGTVAERFVVPETVSAIGRNSFWNCKGIKEIVITKNVCRIGYNPFAGCENLLISDGGNTNFRIEDGLVYNLSGTELLCATDRAAGRGIKIKDGVTHINRGVFSGCTSLESVDFNDVTYIDKSSFTNCTGLKRVFIPDAVTYVGEWAFAYCSNMTEISIGRNTFVDRNAFNGCSATVVRR